MIKTSLFVALFKGLMSLMSPYIMAFAHTPEYLLGFHYGIAPKNSNSTDPILAPDGSTNKTASNKTSPTPPPPNPSSLHIVFCNKGICTSMGNGSCTVIANGSCVPTSAGNMTGAGGSTNMIASNMTSSTSPTLLEVVVAFTQIGNNFGYLHRLHFLASFLYMSWI